MAFQQFHVQMNTRDSQSQEKWVETSNYLELCLLIGLVVYFRNHQIIIIRFFFHWNELKRVQCTQYHLCVHNFYGNFLSLLFQLPTHCLTTFIGSLAIVVSIFCVCSCRRSQIDNITRLYISHSWCCFI